MSRKGIGGGHIVAGGSLPAGLPAEVVVGIGRDHVVAVGLCEHTAALAVVGVAFGLVQRVGRAGQAVLSVVGVFRGAVACAATRYLIEADDGKRGGETGVHAQDVAGVVVVILGDDGVLSVVACACGKPVAAVVAVRPGSEAERLPRRPLLIISCVTLPLLSWAQESPRVLY
ncbi:hypothetical protein SDC9_101149 [bioreactor metagenome]|uniref:Uncharacterized protein n=1 Tax=bioreactor metagenome TaxID=1076179 RepID=A0A645APW9_9ZZZZ